MFVHEYLRGDGTAVRAHFRSKPGSVASIFEKIAENTGKSDIESTLNEIKKYPNMLHESHVTALPLLINEVYNDFHHDYPIAKGLADIFLLKPENIPKNNYIKYIPTGKAEILNEHYNLTKEEVIPKHWPGILFNKTSNVSIETSNSFDLQNTVRQAYNPSTGKFDKNKIGITFNSDPNLFLSLKNAAILEPQIKNGYFQGILFDKYDFKWSNDLYPPYQQRTDWANDFFYLYQNQEESKNRNYYILAPVVFKW